MIIHASFFSEVFYLSLFYMSSDRVWKKEQIMWKFFKEKMSILIMWKTHWKPFQCTENSYPQFKPWMHIMSTNFDIWLIFYAICWQLFLTQFFQKNLHVAPFFCA